MALDQRDEYRISAGEAETRRAHGESAGSDGPINWVRQNFDQLDADKSGRITKYEIEEGMKNPNLGTADGAVYLSAMHDQLGTWSAAFETPGPSGFSRTGLEKFELAKNDKDLLQNNQDKLDASHTTWDFGRVDSDYSTRITLDELNKAIARPGFNATQRHAFEMTKQYYDQILYQHTDKSKLTPEEQKKLAADGITKTDLNDFPDPRAKEVVFMGNSINYFQQRLDELRAHPDQIASQGMNNACFFMAPVIQLQMRNPQAIKDMIHDNPDGTRTVTFPGAKDHPYTVAAPTEAEMTTYANNRDIATIEKAFAIHHYEAERDQAKADKKDPPEEFPELAERLQFGHTSEALELLTGKKVESFDPSPVNELELHDKLTAAADTKQQIIVASKDTEENESYGLTPRHSYMATYDPTTRTLTLTNPLWLHFDTLEPMALDHTPVDGKNDRQFKINLQDLRIKFFEVAHTNG